MGCVASSGGAAGAETRSEAQSVKTTQTGMTSRSGKTVKTQVTTKSKGSTKSKKSKKSKRSGTESGSEASGHGRANTLVSDGGSVDMHDYSEGPVAVEIESRLGIMFQKSQVLKDLTPSERKRLSEIGELVKLKNNEVIITEGQPADVLFVILAGRLETREPGARKPETLKTGAVIGAREVFHRIPFHTKVSSIGDTVLLGISAEDLEPNQKGHLPTHLRCIRDAMAKEASDFTMKYLPEAALFEDMDTEQLSKIAELFIARNLVLGDRVFKEGDEASSFFVIGTGELVVTINDAGGEAGLHIVELTRLTDGASFGESALGEDIDHKRTASVTAVRDTLIFELQKSSFQKFAKLAPAIHAQLFEAMRKRSILQVIAQSSTFKGLLPDKKMEALAAVAVPRTLKPNELLFEEGSTEPKRFYLITDGTVEVLKDPHGKVNELGKGEYFGELSIITGRPHSAGIRAGFEGATVFSVPSEEFLRLFDEEPAIYSEIRVRVLGRKCDLSDVLRLPDAKDAFMEYVKKEIASESLEFYLAAEEFEKLGRQQVKKDVLEAFNIDVDQVVKQRLEELIEAATEVYERFIDPDGETPINIESKEILDIKKLIENEECAYDMFEDAKDTIYNLMAGDNFERFRNSEEFDSILERIGNYEGGGDRGTRAQGSMVRKLDKHTRRQLKKKKNRAMMQQVTINRNDTSRIRKQIAGGSDRELSILDDKEKPEEDDEEE